MQYTLPRRRIIRWTLTSPPRAATVAPMSEPLMRTRRWTRQEYGRLIDLGFFGEDRKGNKVELLEGRMIVAEPQNTPHATACDLAGEALRAAFGSGWRVRMGLPMAMDPDSEPEPDFAVLRGSPRDWLA